MPYLTSRMVSGALLVTTLLVVTEARAQELAPRSFYFRGTQQIDISLGYASWLEESASGGGYGFGAGYHYFLNPVVAVGLDVSAERLGRVSPATGGVPFDFQVVSLSPQLTVHAKSLEISPYLGAGAGPHILRRVRDGDSERSVRWGLSGRAGFRAVGMRPVLGLDGRYTVVLLDPDVENGVAPGKSATHFVSLRATLSWSF